MIPEKTGLHAELGLKQGSIKEEPYNVIKVHIGDFVCTFQLPSQQYEFLKEQGVDPFELMNSLVSRIGMRTN